MPAKAKIRPSRIDVEPPARSSVRAIAPCAPRAKSSDAMAATAATGIAQAAPEQDALQVGRAHRMPERGRVEIAKLGERERPGREREAEIRVRELPAQPLTGAAEDLLVVVGEVGQLVERMPARVLGHLRV